MFFLKNIISSPFGKITTGFFFHLLGQAIVSVTGNQIFQALICTIGWYFIIKGSSKIKRFCIPFHGLYKLFFILYIILCIIMIVRGYMIDYNYQWISLQGLINFHFFSPYYILPYLMPLIVFIPLQSYDFRPFIKCSVAIAYISILIFVIFFKQITNNAAMQALGIGGEYGFGTTFAQIYIPVAFAVLCRKYIQNKVWLINSIGLLFALIIFAISARRGSTVITACLFLFNLYFYIKSRKGSIKIFSIFISIIILLILALFFTKSNKLSFLRERGLEDTRSGVDIALLSQMSDTELIFGKGLNGRYYYPLSNDDYLNGWRYGSETGFYNLVLKGGYVLAYLYIILLAYPALLGIFKSKNELCKALGFYIILSLIELYPFGWLAFNMKFLIIWMGVSLCYNKSIRKLSDSEIYSFFFSQYSKLNK